MPPTNHADQKKFPYFNRELSRLAFNGRVMNLARDKSFPILERLRFLAIASANLDEFFEIRVAGLKQQTASGVCEAGFDGLDPREVLQKIRSRANALLRDRQKIFYNEILPQLRKHRIDVTTPDECSKEQQIFIAKFFREKVCPTLTPMAAEPEHPFPFLRNKGVYVALSVAKANAKRAPSELAIVNVPPILPRIINVDTRKNAHTLVFLCDIIKQHAAELFPGYIVRNKALIRVTRNSELYIDEEERKNLLKTIEDELHRKQKGAAVRIETENAISETSLRTLLNALNLESADAYKVENGPLNPMRFWNIYETIDNPKLKFKSFKARIPQELREPDKIFDEIERRDFLLHHPYDSFEPVENFIARAVDDDSVFAIKLTLYRTNGDSKILNSLKAAARKGKQVTVLIELKARGDEEQNIKWARELEEAGAHVVYGIPGLKTHCKICLIVRNNPKGGMKFYAHIGTGNYNSKTAKAYTDLSFLTADKKICDDVAVVFNTLTGKVANPNFKKLIVAPYTFHSKFPQFIRREIQNAKLGKPARIIAKINALLEQSIIDLLYEASRAGVKIDLIVRGICGIVPGVKGLSENISVRSIVGVFLEHSRIYYFENAGNPQIFAGSGDLMRRNMFTRVECIYPIEQPDLKKRIEEEMLATLLKDTAYAEILRANGSYDKIKALTHASKFCAQEKFMQICDEANV